MFGLGMMELVVIAIVALLVVGPDKLPEAAKKISRGIRDFRQQTRELSKTIDEDTELGSAVRDLKSALRGDDFRPMAPRNVVKPVVDAAEDAVKAASGGGEAAGVDQVGELAKDHPERDEREALAESKDVPVVKLAVGAVANGESVDVPEEDDDKAHG
jgi:Tat protein translocase TatB subunit